MHCCWAAVGRCHSRYTQRLWIQDTMFKSATGSRLRSPCAGLASGRRRPRAPSRRLCRLSCCDCTVMRCAHTLRHLPQLAAGLERAPREGSGRALMPGGPAARPASVAACAASTAAYAPAAPPAAGRVATAPALALPALPRRLPRRCLPLAWLLAAGAAAPSRPPARRHRTARKRRCRSAPFPRATAPAAAAAAAVTVAAGPAAAPTLTLHWGSPSPPRPASMQSCLQGRQQRLLLLPTPSSRSPACPSCSASAHCFQGPWVGQQKLSTAPTRRAGSCSSPPAGPAGPDPCCAC